MSEQPDEEVLWVGSKEWVRQEEDRKANEAAMAIKALNPLVAPVERPEMPALKVTDEDIANAFKQLISKHTRSWSEASVYETVEGHRANNTDLWREAVYKAPLIKRESELLSALSRIGELEQGPCCRTPWCGGECTCKVCAPDLAIRDLEAERDQLKARVKVSDAFWDLLHRAKHILEDVEVGLHRTAQARKWLDDRDELSPTPHMQEETAMRAKPSRILAITETPEWFDSPCARAVREVLEGK